MKLEPDTSSIEWGKKFSLKDKTPYFVLILFLIAVFVLIMAFSSVNNKCYEKDSDSNKTDIQKSSN
jgi:flagellar biosynthesis/type III secretory pathway M-ring protein FliF/YscJ